MNSFISKTLILAAAFSSCSYSMQGQCRQLTTDGTISHLSSMNWYTQTLQYTPGLNPAGVVFEYPIGLFDTPPYVVLSIQQDGFAPSNTITSHVVSWNSTSSAGIVLMVAEKQGNLLSISEANDTYYVTLYATGT